MSAYNQSYDEFNDELLHVAPIQPWMNWRYVYDQLNATAHCRVSTVSIKQGRKGLYAIVRILDCDEYLADFLRENRAFGGPAAFDAKTQMWSYWKIGHYKTPAQRNGTHQVVAKQARQLSPSPPSQITHEEANVLAKRLLETLHVQRPTSPLDEPPSMELLDAAHEEEKEEEQEEQDQDQPQEKLFEIVYDPALLMSKPPAKRVRVKRGAAPPVK